MTYLAWSKLWEGILEQCATRLLFCLLLFHRRFSVDLPHQIVENLTGKEVFTKYVTLFVNKQILPSFSIYRIFWTIYAASFFPTL